MKCLKNSITTCCPIAPHSEFHLPVPNTIPKPGIGGKGGKKKEESKPQVLSTSHFLPLSRKEIKYVNENYFPNIALLFIASKKFHQQAMLLTISSQGMHDWSRTDLT